MTTRQVYGKGFTIFTDSPHSMAYHTFTRPVHRRIRTVLDFQLDFYIKE
jgi:hypothetical protein